MIKKPIKSPKESEIKLIIRELKDRGVYRGKDDKPLETLDYFTLVSLLAIRRAVES